MALVRKAIQTNNQGDSVVTPHVEATLTKLSVVPNQNSHFSPSYEQIATGRVHESLVVASVDKLFFVTKFLPTNYEELLEESEKSFRGDGRILTIDENTKNSIWFTNGIGEHDSGLRVSLNPSKFISAWKMIETVERWFGKAGLSARVKRVDCTITFPEPFDEVFRGLDFGRKRSVECWRDTPKGRSFYVGRKDNRHELIVYDKSKQLNQFRPRRKTKLKRKPKPLTRIEINAVPVNEEVRVDDISKVLEFEPCRNITRYRVLLIPPSANASRAVLERFYEFKALVEKFGLWQTTRDLQKKSKRNFRRDYGDFYELEELQPTLDEIFQLGIRGFFNQ